ncbi:MAG: hypothetical protein AAFY10_00425 [Pseudomonadota bacterium]
MVDNLAQGEWSVSHRQALVRERMDIDLRLVGALFLIAVIAAALRPPFAFSIDDMIYVEMARVFWQEGTLYISERGGVAGAPELVLQLTHGIDGRVYPQYPALYGVIAAPIYGLAGVRGLVFLNAASFLAVLWLTLRIVRHLYGLALDRRFVAGLLAVATFMPVYALGIWPHMFALVLVMAGVERATSHLARGGKADPISLILAGLWLGAAIAIRVDSLMPAIAVVFWLALLGAPRQRSAPLWLMFGILPFIVLAAALNVDKFGTYSPISYGPKTGTDGVARYLPHFGVLAAVLAAAIWFNPEGPRARTLVSKLRTPFFAIPLLMIAGAVVLLAGPLRTLVWNAYVLMVDLQQMDASQIRGATQIGADGLIQILGIHKKSLLQSSPWLVLGAVAVGGFVLGQRTAARGLCLLISCAVVGFYSLTQWHGGYSFNMRYFLPALPFMAILSVDGFTSLCRGVGSRQRRSGLIAGGVLGFLTLATVWLSPLPSGYTLLYPALIVAAALVAFSFAVSAGRRQLWLKQGWLLVTGAAVSMACVATASDLAGQHQRTARYAPITTTAAATLPEDALLVTTVEEHFLLSPKAGTHLVSAKRGDGQVARAAIAAFRAEGRCVFVHTQATLTALGENGDWSAVSLPGLSGSGATLFQPNYQAPRCALAPSA